MKPVVPPARHLAERFCPNTGVPLRVGMVWPPRLVVHSVCSKGLKKVNEAIASVFVKHELRRPVEVVLRPGNSPAHDPSGHPIPGLTIGRSARLIDGAKRWEVLPITLRWSPELQQRLIAVAWVRKEIIIELKSGRDTRTFRWYAYLTPDAPNLPLHASLYDDHPHYRWVTHNGDSLQLEGVSERWIELPAPMSSPALTPACWVQARRLSSHDPGPMSIEILPVFPLEPAVPEGAEVAGWNGALGGHDRRPMLLPLAVESVEGEGGGWQADLEYWDTPLEGQSGLLRQTSGTVLELPTPCVWPTISSAESQPLQLYQLRNTTEKGTDIKVNIRFRMPNDAEPIKIVSADIYLASEKIGRWLGEDLDIFAGREWSLPCVINQDRIAESGYERLKLTVVFRGRPRRGIFSKELEFRTENGPYVQVHQARYVSGKSRRPWLVIDLGTEGTCASVAFLDGYSPRVLTISFSDGPIYPSRVYVAPEQGGTWTLTDQPTDDALYTTGIKLGLRFGDGAHPGCPDHVSAIDVARFYLKRFLLEVCERAAWFPLEECDVLVSFPPRLTCMPRFVGAMKEVFSDVVSEVLWPDGKHGRIRYREEAFMVAMPCLYKDLEILPLPPGQSRFYWVMDFGGGTTDICGFLCTADAYGEEHTISNFSYPQRFPHHLSGNDITAAFYETLRRYLVAVGVVAGVRDGETSRRFVFPVETFPSTRSTHNALLNQTALRELADILKCTPVEAQSSVSVRDVAKTLRSTTIRTTEGINTTLVALLGAEAATLGNRTVLQLHADVIDPNGAKITQGGASQRTASPGRKASKTATVRCVQCDEAHVLPIWVFSTDRVFRFRCKACGKAQQLRGLGDTVLPEGTDDGAPTILAWQDDIKDPDQHILLKQDHQNYRVPDWETVRRWIKERRVGPDDRVSETGVVWDRLRDRLEVSDLFDEEPLQTEEHKEPDTEIGAVVRTKVPWANEGEELGATIESFLSASQVALEEALRRVTEPGAPAPEVVVLLAGRASQFQPIADGVHANLRGRVVHLTNDWVQRTHGKTGVIDPTSGLKTLTVNGGGLFALNQTHTDTSQLLLSFNTQRIECDTYLDIGTENVYWLTEIVDLKPGGQVEVVGSGRRPPTDGYPPLPPRQALLGDLQLMIEGLSEDRVWAPWVTIGKGVVRRVEGHRPRRSEDMVLSTHEGRFVLRDLAGTTEVEFEDLLPRLELLGEE